MAVPSWQRLLTLLSLFVSDVNAANGDWKLTYPPWGESGTPTSGGPKIWFPLIGPFTRHSCFPSRYMSMRIAVNHVNRRDSTLCPAIATLTNKFEMTYDIADSNSNGVGAARAALKVLNNASKKVNVILGPNGSGSSMTMSNILAVFKIPHISWGATNAALSNKATYPMFFRVVSPDSLVMKVLAGWLKHLKFQNVNFAYFDASFQSGQAHDFLSVSKTTYSLTISVFKIPNSGSGGAAVLPSNMPHVKSALEAIRSSGHRVVVASALNEEAYGLFKMAYDMQMVDGEGWMWLGTDGLAGGQLAGQLDRIKYFRGSVYIQAITKGPTFPTFASKWAELMPTTSRPEFSTFPLCVNKTTNEEGICEGHPEFKGWKNGTHDVKLQCTGYTGLVYDAVVTLAVVADKLMGKGKDPNSLTNLDWLEEMRALSTPGQSFDCLTGKVSFNKNQERDMPMGIFNWHMGSLVSTMVLSWNGNDGYKWVVGANVVWPSGAGGTVTDANEFFIPTGGPPDCVSGSVYNNSALKCQICPKGSFTSEREGEDKKRVVVCDKCPAGTYSATVASTRCIACGKGLFSGAAGSTACTTCPAGKFNGEIQQESCRNCSVGQESPEAALSCTSCDVGQFASVPGSANCTQCPGGMTTRQIASVRSDMCVCSPGAYMPASASSCKVCPGGMISPIASTLPTQCYCGAGLYKDLPPMNNTCQKCKEGMTCEIGSDVSTFFRLHPNGQHLEDDAEVSVYTAYPKLTPGFWSSHDAPLSIFQCSMTPGGDPVSCPGGDPGTCNDLLEGVACATCPEKMTYSEDKCVQCSWHSIFLWAISIPMIIVGLTVAYYVINNPVTAKASILLSSTCSLGMTVTMMQTLAIVGSINPSWPGFLGDIFAFFNIFTFDFEQLGFSCLAGHDVPVRYWATVLVFPGAIAYLALFGVVSQLLPVKSRRADLWKLMSTMGAFLQLSFTSLSTVAFKPFMCYSQPNGKSSVSSYPVIVCGTSEHATMQAGAAVLMVLGTAFLSLTTLAALQAPMWAAQGKHHRVIACKFLLFRFRMDRYAFGSLLTFRGPLLTLPMAVATDYPNIQTFSATLVVLFFLVAQLVQWPWKVPIFNVIDGLVSAILLLLLFVTNSFLDPVSSDISGGFEKLTYSLLALVAFTLMFMFILAMSALYSSKAMGGSQDFTIMNLGKNPPTAELVSKLAKVSQAVVKLDPSFLESGINKLHVSEVATIAKYITLLVTEVSVVVDDGQSFILTKRLSSNSFTQNKKKEPEAKVAPEAKVVPGAEPEAKLVPEAVQDSYEQEEM